MASKSDTLLTEGKEQKAQESDDTEDGPECAVCLQPCVLPTRLPCRHVFCFLCAKGLALQSRRCAMCRAEIPQDFLDRPELLPAKAGGAVKAVGESSVQPTADHTYAWFYEGRNGWWQYEGRLTADLEATYQRGERTHDALIAGSLYTLDFNNWVQLRRDDPSRRRRIKRDLASSQHKGVAGIRELASHSGASSGIAALAAAPQAGYAAPQTAQAQQQPQVRGGVGGVQGGRMGLARGAAVMSSYPWPVPRPSLPSHALPVSSDSSHSSSSDEGYLRIGGVGVELTGTTLGLREAASRAGAGLTRAFLALTTSEQSSQQQPPLPSPPVSMQHRHSAQLTWMPSSQRQVRMRANGITTAPQMTMTSNMTPTTSSRVPVERRRRRRTNPTRPTSSSSEDDLAS